MKNITVTIPKEIYIEARVLAARQDTSVSALFRQFLETLVEDPSPAFGPSGRRRRAKIQHSEGVPPPPYIR